MTEPLQTAVAFALMMAAAAVVGGAGAAADARGWIQHDRDPSPADAMQAQAKDRGRPAVSPRMDFEQWTPLGRGDPLKDDPTFDYLPPALDKVRYWRTQPTAPPAASAGRVHTRPSAAAAPVQYNRRFFLTDFSRKEPAAVMQQQAYAPYKRPAAAAAVPILHRGGYLPPPPPRPKTPLPMLTPPPYQWPTAGTTVLPVDVPTLMQLLLQQQQQQQQTDAGDSAAESKRPPDVVRAPPPPHSAAVIKTMLDAEVDRTTVTTAGPERQPPQSTPVTIADRTTTTTTTTTTTQTAIADRTTLPPQQLATADRPLQSYLIIQGHSRVKTYGLQAIKADALRLSAAAATAQDHNHVGHDGPDRGEASRRKKRDIIV